MRIIDEVRRRMYAVEEKTFKKPFEIVLSDDLMEQLASEINPLSPVPMADMTDLKLFGLPVITSPYPGVLEVR